MKEYQEKPEGWIEDPAKAEAMAHAAKESEDNASEMRQAITNKDNSLNPFQSIKTPHTGNSITRSEAREKIKFENKMSKLSYVRAEIDFNLLQEEKEKIIKIEEELSGKSDLEILDLLDKDGMNDSGDKITEYILEVFLKRHLGVKSILDKNYKKIKTTPFISL